MMLSCLRTRSSCWFSLSASKRCVGGNETCEGFKLAELGVALVAARS